MSQGSVMTQLVVSQPFNAATTGLLILRFVP